MENITFDIQRGRTWLFVQYKGRQTKFAYPPVHGTHKECFEAINNDNELRPAEGLELALLTHGAYTRNEPEWKSVRQDCFVNNYVRVPMRNLWIPKNSFREDMELSGVIVEKDFAGKGLSNKMEIPVDLSGWKEENGIYVSADKNRVFVPSDKYTLGEHNVKSFVKDGYACAILTSEGAEIFAKTAVDAGKVPYVWGVNVNKIQNPEQRVTLLGGLSDRLNLDGGWYDDRDLRAFGVCKSGSFDMAAPKK